PKPPRSREPSVPSSLPNRKAATAASAVRTRLIFVMPVRSPGRYGASHCFAITPSAVPVSHWRGAARAGGFPGGGAGGVALRGGERHRSPRPPTRPSPPLGVRERAQHLVALGQQVEGHE